MHLKFELFAENQFSCRHRNEKFDSSGFHAQYHCLDALINAFFKILSDVASDLFSFFRRRHHRRHSDFGCLIVTAIAEKHFEHLLYRYLFCHMAFGQPCPISPPSSIRTNNTYQLPFHPNHFLWRSDLCRFKELLIPAKITHFSF